MRFTKNTPPATALAVLCIAGGVFYYHFDPLRHPWMPQCLFHRITGLQCAGCGSQRMLHSLLHLDFKGAWEANALALVSIPLLAFLTWLECNRTAHASLYRRIHSTAAIACTGIVITAWFFYRNLA